MYYRIHATGMPGNRFMRFQSSETMRIAVSARDPRAISRSASHGSMTVNFAAIFETKRSRSTAASRSMHSSFVKDRGAPLHSHYAPRVRNACDGRERVNAVHPHACRIPGSLVSANSIVEQCSFASKSRASWYAAEPLGNRATCIIDAICIINYCELTNCAAASPDASPKHR